MKVIDLLNKIANGEDVPNKFKFDGFIYDKQSEKCYRCAKTLKIFEDNFILEDLNKEIEIIEENKKIEYIECHIKNGKHYIENSCFRVQPLEDLELNQNEIVIIDKINEIIDKINKMEEK